MGSSPVILARHAKAVGAAVAISVLARRGRQALLEPGLAEAGVTLGLAALARLRWWGSFCHVAWSTRPSGGGNLDG